MASSHVNAVPGVARKTGSGCGAEGRAGVAGAAPKSGMRRPASGRAVGSGAATCGAATRAACGLMLDVGGALVIDRRSIVVSVVWELRPLQAGHLGVVVAGREVLGEHRRDVDVESPSECGDVLAGLAVRVDRDARGIAPPHECLDVGVVVPERLERRGEEHAAAVHRERTGDGRVERERSERVERGVGLRVRERAEGFVADENWG